MNFFCKKTGLIIVMFWWIHIWTTYSLLLNWHNKKKILCFFTVLDTYCNTWIDFFLFVFDLIRLRRNNTSRFRLFFIFWKKPEKVKHLLILLFAINNWRLPTDTQCYNIFFMILIVNLEDLQNWKIGLNLCCFCIE